MTSFSLIEGGAIMKQVQRWYYGSEGVDVGSVPDALQDVESFKEKARMLLLLEQGNTLGYLRFNDCT
jgi:hypothetical protein